jgi:hypothetical protein
MEESIYERVFRPPPPTALFSTPANLHTPMEREERLYVSRVYSARPESSETLSIPFSTPQRRTEVSNNTVPSTYNQSQLDFIASEHEIESPEFSIHMEEEMSKP